MLDAMQTPFSEPPAEPAPPRRQQRRWLLGGIIALGVLAILGIGALIGANISTANAATVGSNSANTSFIGGRGDRQAGFNATPGATGPGGSNPANCGTLTVTSVNGTTIVAKASDGTAVTIHTSSTTQYTQAHQSATASAVKVGSVIHVDGATNSDGSVNATAIDVQ